MIDKNADNIQVMVRVRPLNEREIKEGSKSCVIVNQEAPNTIILDAKPEQKVFKFDYVGGEETTQDDIFKIAGKPLTQAAIEGFNTCLFAYGQTGAGKTFTMQGRGLEKDSVDSVYRGVQPRVFDYLFAITNKEKRENNTEYLIKCCYLEIYNEQIMDLLSSTCNNLQVREDLKKGVYIEGLIEEGVQNSDESIELLRKGARNRHVGATNMNFESSRSHSVFTMTIESKKVSEGMVNVKQSKLHFVDLAGSERQKQTQTIGDRLKEASNINKSLTTLGLVINSLVEASQGKSRHIPYRDSKLTFLLKDSLGGNSRTCMVAAISAASTSFQETLSTLKFAQRAKLIKNKASINEESSGNIESLKKEIKRLKDELIQKNTQISSLELEIKNGGGMPRANDQQMDEELSLPGQEFSSSGKKIYLSGKKSPQGHHLNEITMVQVSEMTKKQNDFEDFIKQHLSGIKEQNDVFSIELSKKEHYINKFKEAAISYKQSELQYKTIIYLQEDRINKLRNNSNSLIDSDMFINEDYELLTKQFDALLQILQSSTCVYEVYLENVEQKQIIDQLQGEANPTSQLSLCQVAVQNTQSLGEIMQKLEDNVQEKKQFQDKLERLNLFRLSTPEKVKQFEENVSKLKIEYNEKIENLNYQIITLKQRETVYEKNLELEKKKVHDQQEDIKQLKIKNQLDIESYEQRINNVMANFHQIEQQKTETSSEFEQQIGQMNITILELETKNANSIQRIAQLQKELEEKENTLQQRSDEITQQINEFNTKQDQFFQEKSQLESQLKTAHNSLEIVTQDLNKSKQENLLNQKQIEDLTETMSNLTIQIEQVKNENQQKETAIKNLEQEKSTELIKLENQLQIEIQKISAIESEKIKLQEELDVSNSTYAYQQGELEEKRNLVAQQQQQITVLQKQFQDASEKAKSQEQINENFRNQIINQNQHSPNNLAIKENKDLHEQNHELRMQVEFESNQNISLRSQLSQMNNRINEVTQSEEHFRSAYLDIRNQLQNLVQKNKDLQQALSSKEMDQYELQRDMKNANENIQFLQERIASLKDELKSSKQLANKSCEQLKIAKEKFVQLQETLQQKIEDLQRSYFKSKEQENILSKLQKENDDLKLNVKNQLQISEKRVSDLLNSFSIQQKENKDLQTILNAKIEENLALTANTRILQNLIEKQSQGETEQQQKMVELQEKFENERNALKMRVDKLIESIKILEQSQQSESNKQELQKSQQEILRLQQLNKNLEDKIGQIEKQSAYLADTHQHQLGEKERKIQDLSKQLQNKDQSFQATVQQIKDQINKYQDYIQEASKIKEENNQIKQQLKEKQEIIQKLEEKVNNNATFFQQNQKNNNMSNPNNNGNMVNTEEFNKLKKKLTDTEKMYQDLLKHQNDNKENIDDANIMKEKIQQLSKEKQDQSDKINELNKKIFNMYQQKQNNSNSNFVDIENENPNSQSELMVFLQQQMNQITSEIQQDLQTMNKSIVKNLPKLNQGQEISDHFQFILPAFHTLIDYTKEKEKVLKQVMKDLETKDLLVSKLEKENTNLQRKITGQGLMTPKPIVSGLMTPKNSNFINSTNQQQQNNIIMQTSGQLPEKNQFQYMNNNGNINGTNLNKQFQHQMGQQSQLQFQQPIPQYKSQEHYSQSQQQQQQQNIQQQQQQMMNLMQNSTYKNQASKLMYKQ